MGRYQSICVLISRTGKKLNTKQGTASKFGLKRGDGSKLVVGNFKNSGLVAITRTSYSRKVEDWKYQNELKKTKCE